MRILLQNSRARWGLAILGGYLLMALFGPWLCPLDRLPHYEERFLYPSLDHWLGTDYAGRDVFAQIVNGTRDILLIAFSTGLFATMIALLVGLGGGLWGGVADTLLTGFTDIFLTVPSLPVLAILASLFKVGDPITFGFVLGLWSWAGLARSLRTQVQSLLRKEFVEVARVMMMGPVHLLTRELFPNLVPYVTLNFISIARNAITASVGIMTLGLVPLRSENWGMMLNLAAFQSGALFLPQGLTYLLAPLCAIILFQVSLILIAAGLEEAFDPRLGRSA